MTIDKIPKLFIIATKYTLLECPKKLLKSKIGSYQKYVTTLEIDVANRIPGKPIKLPRITETIRLITAVDNITYFILL